MLARLIDRQGSLTFSTLLSIAIRISLIVALTALLSYLYSAKTIQESSLQTLQKYVRGRALREREIFKLAHDNHVIMRREIDKAFRQIEQSREDPLREFSSLVKRDPDGALRAPRKARAPQKELDVWIAKTTKLSPELRRKVVAFSKVLLRFGPAFHTRFTDTYVALGENANLVYWPEFPDWSAGVAADFYFPNYELYANGSHQNNPERKTLWTGLYFDDAVGEWMVSASTPIDDGQGKFAGIIGHDLMVGELIKRTVNDGLPGTYNILINSDGRIIAHPQKMDALTKAKGNLRVSDTNDPVLAAIYEEISRIPPAQRTSEKIIDHAKYDQFIAVSYMPETGWDFVTIYPKSLIWKVANRSAFFIGILGLLSLLLELVILYFIFQKKVARPMRQFIRATHEIEAGKAATTLLETERQDEFGILARSFYSMERKITEANANLQERVEQRTAELREAQQEAMKNAHAAGMAEIATNILHNIGNAVNSVNLSAMEIQGQLELPQLRNLEKALALIQENQSALGEYLQNDPKGRLLPEYLSELVNEIAAGRENRQANFDYMLRKLKMIEAIVFSQQQYVKVGSFVEDVDMKQVVNECIGMLNLGNTREKFRLLTQMEDFPPIRAQRVKIMQIVLNLLKNAVDSINSLPAETLKEIEIKLIPLEKEILFSVRDSGQGIAPENIHKIFGHGFTTKKNGHGFGLHFCANAARELGGSLQVESAGLGQGAIFQLRLPRQR